mmetsp:Transcript_35162/g.56008  ORF Transcript_35162/g.56008 Transcript_35162/m.56008 type:complete len:235 (+) Transcript_35162:4553-5257(+)
MVCARVETLLPLPNLLPPLLCFSFLLFSLCNFLFNLVVMLPFSCQASYTEFRLHLTIPRDVPVASWWQRTTLAIPRPYLAAAHHIAKPPAIQICSVSLVPIIRHYIKAVGLGIFFVSWLPMIFTVQLERSSDNRTDRAMSAASNDQRHILTICLWLLLLCLWRLLLCCLLSLLSLLAPTTLLATPTLSTLLALLTPRVLLVSLLTTPTLSRLLLLSALASPSALASTSTLRTPT